ncbi:MAG TPA: succinate dehydrogenase assembly factor 2 [Rhodocyclaceae bacterium]|nr:succinate dehydrogenase assembly factor 2 [Zoogloeaceae bacterium]HRD33821.1 succinate dehydrogenase assembly factor 2 [Rhodocyclaceae bacterium]
MMINKGRLQWQCRRALLELDLVFKRFLERDFDRLDDGQLVALEELLRLEDHDLWAIVNGSKPSRNAREGAIVALLRAP